MQNEEQKLNQEVPLEPTQSSNLPTQPKKSFGKKWFILGFVVILFIVSLSGAYLLGKNQTTSTKKETPTPTKATDETANWKTYINNVFTFKYPKYGILNKNIINNNDIYVSLKLNNINIDILTGSFLDTDFSCLQEVKKTTVSIQGTKTEAIIEKPITGKELCDPEKTSTQSELDKRNLIISIGKVGDKNRKIIHAIYNGTDQELNSILEILSTFKFTQSTVEPINATQFTKTLVSQDNCNNPLGLIAYKGSNFDYMKINNTNTKQNTYSEKGISAVNNYLQGKANLTNLQDLNSWEFPFHDYCGGTTNIYLKELSANKYTNTESSKTLLEYTTQSMFGTTTVYVFARKGDDLIQLSSPITDDATYERIGNKCHPNYKKDLSNFKPADEECYKNALSNDPELQKIATDKANDLIQTFAIKQ